MAVTKTLLVICVAILGVFGASDVSILPQPTEAPNVTTSASPPTKPTTASTTSATTVTTTATTTTAPPTTKPTPAPSPNTTTALPPTTPKPTPAPAPVDPKVANWTVDFEKSNRSCIVFEAAIQYEILGPNQTESLKINVPVEAAGSGSCKGANTQNLKVTWGVNNSLEFDFVKPENTSKFALGDVKTTLNVTSPVPKVYNLVHDKAEFSTPTDNSYKCARVQTLDLTEENSNVTVAYLHISHLQYQAFQNVTENKFQSALDCDPSITSDVVPIVVGCVLAVLVVMVLVAYLVGRRRCQARGYLSM